MRKWEGDSGHQKLFCCLGGGKAGAAGKSMSLERERNAKTGD